MMLAKPGVLLRIEGAAMLASTLFLYRCVEGRWVVFFVLFLWPDLLMVGYLLNAKIGARLYNLVHTDVLPLALAAISLPVRQSALLMFAIIWLAHIAADRALGYGLKYPTCFQDTHLQRVSEKSDQGQTRHYSIVKRKSGDPHDQ